MNNRQRQYGDTQPIIRNSVARPHAHGEELEDSCAQYVIGRVKKLSIKVQTDTHETCLESRMDARSRWGVSDGVGAQPSWLNGICWR